MTGKKRNAAEGVYGRNRKMPPAGSEGGGNTRRREGLKSGRRSLCVKGGCITFTVARKTRRVNGGRQIFTHFARSRQKCWLGVTQLGLKLLLLHAGVEVDAGTYMAQVVAADIGNAGDCPDVGFHKGGEPLAGTAERVRKPPWLAMKPGLFSLSFCCHLMSF